MLTSKEFFQHELIGILPSLALSPTKICLLLGKRHGQNDFHRLIYSLGRRRDRCYRTCGGFESSYAIQEVHGLERSHAGTKRARHRRVIPMRQQLPRGQALTQQRARLGGAAPRLLRATVIFLRLFVFFEIVDCFNQCRTRRVTSS